MWRRICGILFILGVSSAFAVQYQSFSTTVNLALSIVPISSMVALVFELLKAQWDHERKIDIQQKQQDFILTASSHMAEVAYDKHVAFCEEYMQELQKGIEELNSKTPGKTAYTFGWNLRGIRIKHSAWLTETIDTKLSPVEDLLIQIGARYELHHELSGDDRTKVVEEMYDKFFNVLGIKIKGKDFNEDLALKTLVVSVRKILEIDKLTELRRKLIELTSKRLIS